MNLQNKPIILFDGVCNLCNSSVNFIIKKDRKKIFKFTSLQSDVAKKLLLQIESKKFKNSLDSIALIKDNKIYYKSTAALIISKELQFPFNISFLFIIIPKFIRDFFYDVIAKNRYKWFGRNKTCRVPTKKEMGRFL